MAGQVKTQPPLDRSQGRTTRTFSFGVDGENLDVAVCTVVLLALKAAENLHMR